MALETEIKIQIDEPEAIKVKLVRCGFREKETLFERDTYYTAEHHDFAALDEALRVRETENRTTGECTAYTAYKSSSTDERTASRREYETKVDDPAVMKKILESTGFTPVKPMEKLRTHYVRDDITVCADHVYGLGHYLELEVVTEDESGREDAVRKIFMVLRELGLEDREPVTKSYLSMLMKKNAGKY